MSRLARLTACALAALAVLVPAAAVAAEGETARTETADKPVVLLTGPDSITDRTDTASCAESWNAFRDTLRNVEVRSAGVPLARGEIVTVGLHAGDRSCGANLGLPRDATLETVSVRFGAWLKERYPGRPVDVVAHGTAGVVLRFAIARTPDLRVEDAVTIASPHRGAPGLANKCLDKALRPVRMCEELDPDRGGAMLGYVTSRSLRRPQAKDGTDWTAIAGAGDAFVAAESALGMEADHTTLYLDENRYGHDGLLRNGLSSRDDARIRYRHRGDAREQSSIKAMHVVRRVAHVLVFGPRGKAPAGCVPTAEKPCGAPPVVFIPGFLGSELACAREEGETPLRFWVNLGGDIMRDGLLQARLKEDGLTNDASTPCGRTAGPDGVIVETGSQYHDAMSRLKSSFGADAFYAGTWDWRRTPTAELDRIDRVVDRALAERNASKVILVAHSAGGLVALSYLQESERAAKVARVLTLGTPWLGTPKAYLGVAHGVGDPDGSQSMLGEGQVPDAPLMGFLRTSSGLYATMPSDRYGAWFTPDGQAAAQTTRQAAAWMASHANVYRPLLDAGQAEHAAEWDRPNTRGVPFVSILGRGNLTVRALKPRRAAVTGTPEGELTLVYGDGDGTVPLNSASLNKGNGSASGKYESDGITFVELCDHNHDALGGEAALRLRDVVDFLRTGSSIDLNSRTCPVNGNETIVRNLEPGTPHEASASAAQAGGGLTLDQAEARGLADVTRVGTQTIIVTRDSHPVKLRLRGRNLVVRTRAVGDGTSGPQTTYGPVGGTVTLDAGAGTLTRNGTPVPVARPDRTAPSTRIATRRTRGGRVRVTLRATDDSGAAEPWYRAGRGRWKRYTRPFVVSRRALRTLKVRSVDAFGNAERPRPAIR